ncbi:MAG TPA: DPP IV N-terminal domain-containing protein, partial [Longimicrobiaceae bacterium]|nr:DPP IV N-terminal domain-containing protein [Longimicrobiaceae bacterium]
MSRTFRCLAPALAACALAGAAAAQTVAARPAAARSSFPLTVESIMRGPLLVGRSPDEVRWSPDSRWVYFRWRRDNPGDTATAVYRVAAQGGAPERLADSTAARVAPARTGGEWSRAHDRRAEVRNGDVFVIDRGGAEHRITQTPARESEAHLSRDGRTVTFLSGGNVFAVDVAGGTLRQLTDIRGADAPKRDALAGQRGWLHDQQDTLFAVVRDRRAEREHREMLDSLRTALRPIYLGKNASVASAQVSPSGRYLLLDVNESVEGEKATIVPAWVTESGYTEPLNGRGKVGDVQDGERVAVVELATSRVSWVQPEAKDRKMTLTALEWAPDADRALVMGESADFKDRWLYVVGPDGKATTVDRLHDAAWVGGPAYGSAGWLSDERVWFVSERSGYAHLYAAPAAGGEAQALTQGAWEVTDVQLSPDRRMFWLTTSETHPGERGLYAVPAAGGARTRIDRLEGWNEGLVSPDGRWVAVTHSTANEPPELYLMPNRAGAPARRVTESTTAEFRMGPWIKPEVVTFTARDGATVHARIYRPRELGASANGGAVVFVHGAGYLQNAHRGWSTYYREYMFNHLLASRGITVLDVDYRGSAGYGAAWRTGIYRHMGGKDLSDQVDGVRWLVANEGVDAKRV